MSSKTYGEAAEHLIEKMLTSGDREGLAAVMALMAPISDMAAIARALRAKPKQEAPDEDS